MSDILSPESQFSTRAQRVPRRWTLHGLNNGLIFGATYRGVMMLPRQVSYGIARSGSWLAWKAMPQSRQALADNLAPVLPHETRDALEARAHTTLRSYCFDVIDFLRALSARPRDAREMFEVSDGYRELFAEMESRGRGIILVTAHYGNWEVGSVLVRRVLERPLTIVAMREVSATVNRIRRDIRARLGVETIEVRQSLDTPLQIRRRLAANEIVAMLIDRHYGRDRVAVTFFGRRAWLLRTPLMMGYLTGAPIVPCFIERIGSGRFRAEPCTPIYLDRDAPRDEAIGAAAQSIANAVAVRVRRHPEYWYQFYRYWDAQRDAYEGLD